MSIFLNFEFSFYLILTLLGLPFSELGVNLTPFYKLLWTHVLVTEILKEEFGSNKTRKKNFLSKIKNIANPKRKEAFDYLERFGKSFWNDTEIRVKEVTNSIENELKGSTQGLLPQFPVTFEGRKKISSEEKAEIIRRGQDVVSRAQVSKLKTVLDALDELLSENRQKKYYILIDKLDENWVENTLRFRLIRGLIETSIQFFDIENVKIIIALRNDLLDRVYRLTRGPGFQEEKAKNSNLDLIWSDQDLEEVLDLRVHKLVTDQYTNYFVKAQDVMRKVHVNNASVPAIDYMVERTLKRPRDLIHFFNCCIKKSNGKAIIDNNILFQAEGTYSRERFRALLDEWISVYPNLALTSKILRVQSRNFSVSQISQEDLTNFSLDLITSSEIKQTTQENLEAIDYRDMYAFNNGDMSFESYRKRLLYMFYKVSLVGIRLNSEMNIFWSFEDDSNLSESDIIEESRIYIQPTFWRHFGIS